MVAPNQQILPLNTAPRSSRRQPVGVATRVRDDQPVRHHGKVAKGINPWRYVSSGPVNNVQQYDLWAEYVVGDEVWVISNWKSEPFPKAQLSRYYKKKLR